MARVTQTTQQRKNVWRIKIIVERDSNTYKKRLEKGQKWYVLSKEAKKNLLFISFCFWWWSWFWLSTKQQEKLFPNCFYFLWKNISALLSCPVWRVTSRESLHYNVMVVPLLLLCLDKWKSNFILHYHHYYYYTPLLSWESTVPKNSILRNWILELTTHKNIKLYCTKIFHYEMTTKRRIK